MMRVTVLFGFCVAFVALACEPLPDDVGHGVGGSASTSTSTGGDAGGGSAGGPIAPECVTTLHCEWEDDSSCRWRTCEGGRCEHAVSPYGTPYHLLDQEYADTMPGDCQRRVCDGNGGTVLVADDADVEVSSDDCVSFECNNGVRTVVSAAEGASCWGPDACCRGICDGTGACWQGFCDDDGTCGAVCDRTNECSYVAPSPLTHTYAWAKNVGTVMYGTYGQYATSIDEDAMTVYVHDVRANEEITVYASALPIVGTNYPGAACALQLHETTYSGDLQPVDRPTDGGHLDFFVDSPPVGVIAIYGSYRARSDGLVRVRLLGRTSDAGHPCGVVAPAELVVVHYVSQ